MSRPTTAHAPGRGDEQRRGAGTSWVVAGSLASGVGAYGFQVVGTRALGEEAFAPIGVLWTLQYLVLTVALYAVEAYVTRTVTLADGRPGAVTPSLAAIGAWVTGVALLLGGVTYVFRDALYAGAGDLAAVAALLVLTFGGFSVVRGLDAGTRRFRSFGVVSGGESVLRLGLAFVVALLVPTTRTMAWVMPLGPLLVTLCWLWWRRRRPLPPHAIASEQAEVAPRTPPAVEAAEPRGGAGRRTGTFLASTTAANAISQTLIAAGPLVVVPLGAGPGEVSVFFVTMTAARAPLAFAFGGLLSRVLPPLTARARVDARALRQVALVAVPVTVLAAALAGALAWVAGPAVIAAFFGAAFRPSAAFVALAAAGMLLAMGALLLNQVLIACHAERRLLVPWLAALAAALLALALVDAGPTMRVVTAFVTGEVVVLAGLLGTILTARQTSAAPPADTAVLDG